MDSLKWAGLALASLGLATMAAPALSSTSARVAILTTDYTTGSVSCLAVDSSRTMQVDLGAVCPDAVERFHGGLLYVINRYRCGDIEVLDPAHNWSMVREFSVGVGSNPQDIAFTGEDRAWVSRYESNWLLEVKCMHRN